MELKLKLKEILEIRGITQKKVAEMTGLREAAISEMARNSRESLNRKHLGKIANALGITDLNELLYIE